MPDCRSDWPDGVVLDVLGIKVVIQIHNGLEGSQLTVEEQQQQLELSIGGTVRQTILENAQRLPYRVLVPWNTQSGVLQMLQKQTSGLKREESSPVSLHKSMYTWAAMRQYISENCSSVFRALFPVRHMREQTWDRMYIPKKIYKHLCLNLHQFPNLQLGFPLNVQSSYQTSVRDGSELWALR